MRKKIKIALIILGCLFAPFLALRLIPYPELENYRNRSFGFAVLDKNGQTLRVFPAEDGTKRDWAALSEIPAGVINVFIKAEDRRFYLHPGVDPIAIVSAAIRNRQAGRTVSGASTITMQLARLVRPRGQGFRSKIAEAFDALRIESRISKKQILELWLNGIPFGSNIEGVSAISRVRFGRNISAIDDVRALLLAVIPRRPGLYDPAINPEAAVRAALVLAGNYFPGISEAALTEAAAEASPSVMESEKAPFLAPHFTERAAAVYLGLASGGATRAVHTTSASQSTLASLPIHAPLRTTLDLSLQEYAQRRLSEELSALEYNRVSNGAIIVIDNATGAVITYVGSVSWFDDSISGKIDGVQVENQPGSCLKPFLYAYALEKGFGANDVLPDIPTIFGTSEAYSPANFNRRFNGPVRFRVALASSLNVPAVYLLERLGVRNFEEYLINLGFDSISRTMGTHGAGLALGNAEVSLEELVRAFSVFPRMGKAVELRFIEDPAQTERVARGKQLESAARNARSGTQVMSADSAWIIADILADRGSRFIGFGPAPVLATGFPSIFKTGTANQFQHIWALGATSRHTVGVWMGNHSGETVVGRTGSSIPARIAADILQALAQSDPVYNTAVSSSSGATAAGDDAPAINVRQVEICALSGMAAGPYCTGITREWILPEKAPPPCSWHRGGAPVYPPEYQAWLRERFRWGNVSQSGNAYIRIPVSGSVFYYDTALPPEAQAIRIETAGFSPEALVYDGDTLQGTLNQAGVFSLRLSRGRHRLYVEDENSTAFVDIEVR